MGVEQIDTFWLEVGQAYAKVAANHDLEVAVERDNKRAVVEWSDLLEEPGVHIAIIEVDTHVEEVLPKP